MIYSRDKSTWWAFIRAMGASQKLLLANEPTGALDTRIGEDIMSLFKKLNGDRYTVIIITHDLQIAKQ